MMRGLAAVCILALAGCGSKEEPKPVDPVRKSSSGGTSQTPKGDPDGTYTCMKCQVKWKEPKCKGCGEVLKVENPSTNTGGGGSTSHSGGTAVSVSYKCPKSGCTYTDPRKGKCLNHADIDMKECWFVCSGCSVKEPAKGKCKKCGKDLAENLE